MATTAVQDRLVLDRDTELKPYMGVTGAAEDVFIDFLTVVCKRKADDYLLNTFVDSAGADLPIPNPVKLGVMKCVKSEYEEKGTSSAAAAAGPLIKQKAGDLEEQYGFSGAIVNPDGSSLSSVVQKLWSPYRLVPGL